MGWNPQRTSVGSRWGRGPTIVQQVPARLMLPTRGNLKAYVLDPVGKRVKPAAISSENRTLTLTARPEDGTILYELAGN